MEVPKRIVLDTTALVNHLRAKGPPSTVTRLEGKAELATTIVNLFELFHGAYKYKEVKLNLAAVKGLQSTLRILQLTVGATEHGAKILADLQRSGVTVEMRDLLVGAIALEEGFAVVTENVEHFSHIPGLLLFSERELSSML